MEADAGAAQVRLVLRTTSSAVSSCHSGSSWSYPTYLRHDVSGRLATPVGTGRQRASPWGIPPCDGDKRIDILATWGTDNPPCAKLRPALRTGNNVFSSARWAVLATHAAGRELGSPLRIPVREFRQKSVTGFLSRSLRPRTRSARAWACGCARASLRSITEPSASGPAARPGAVGLRCPSFCPPPGCKKFSMLWRYEQVWNWPAPAASGRPYQNLTK